MNESLPLSQKCLYLESFGLYFPALGFFMEISVFSLNAGKYGQE